MCSSCLAVGSWSGWKACALETAPAERAVSQEALGGRLEEWQVLGPFRELGGQPASVGAASWEEREARRGAPSLNAKTRAAFLAATTGRAPKQWRWMELGITPV